MTTRISPHGVGRRRIQPKITMSFTSFREATRYPQRSYRFNLSNIFLRSLSEISSDQRHKNQLILEISGVNRGSKRKTRAALRTGGSPEQDRGAKGPGGRGTNPPGDRRAARCALLSGAEKDRSQVSLLGCHKRTFHPGKPALPERELDAHCRRLSGDSRARSSRGSAEFAL